VIRKILFIAAAIACPLVAQSEGPPTKVGIIHIQNALLGTKEGQKAAQDLQAKFEPTSKKLQSMRDEINRLQAELSKGSNTMGEERRRELARQIDQKTRELNRATEDAQDAFQQEQQKILQRLGQKMMAVIGKYSREHGYAVILDVSNPQSPVLYAANGVDITQDIIKLYDEEAEKAAVSSASPSSTGSGTSGQGTTAAAAKP